MTRTLTISDTGLRLIKAFEGFRPDDKTLVTGVRVVGYGHKLGVDDDPVNMSRVEAEEQLLEDLEPIEILINDEVHAPLSQGQYDALCSLGFNIGLEALRHSDIVRALNNGRVLDAANGFDVWRKASVNGQIYVVDALMRRRTAEKSLFLRNDPAVPAPTAMLRPQKDITAPLGPTDDGFPRVTDDPDLGIVEGTSFTADLDQAEMTPTQSLLDDAFDDASDFTEIDTDDLEIDFETQPYDLTTDDDDEVIALTADDIIDDELDMAADFDPNVILEASNASDTTDDETVQSEETSADILEETPSEEETQSSIAEAATSLGDRLTALLDSEDDENADKLAKAIPSSLVDPEDNTPRSNLVSFPKREKVLEDDDLEVAVDESPETLSASETDEKASADSDMVVIDNLAEDDVIRASRDPGNLIFDPDGDPAENAALYLERRSQEQAQSKSGGGFWIPLIIGSLLLGASAALMGRGATQLLSNWGPIAVIAAAITGGLMMLFAVYALMRGRFA